MSISFDIADPERRLALAYAPRDRRPALALLWALDERLGSIVAATREAMLGEIRLAWWRDALAGLDEIAPAGEPLLESLMVEVRAGRVSSALLNAMPDGWLALLEPMPLSADALTRFAERRGAGLFRAAASVLGAEQIDAGAIGAVWALTDLARRMSDRETTAAALTMARQRTASLQCRGASKSARPIVVLAALAREDCARAVPQSQGSPSRLLRALWAGLSGRC